MSKIVKKKLKIEGMHCVSCALNIDGQLEDAEGVEEACTHFARSELKVVYHADKITVEEIISIITRLGYKAASADRGTT